MTRYSNSRGIMYSAPPGPDEEPADGTTDEGELPVDRESVSGEPTAADD